MQLRCNPWLDCTHLSALALERAYNEFHDQRRADMETQHVLILMTGGPPDCGTGSGTTRLSSGEWHFSDSFHMASCSTPSSTCASCTGAAAG